MKMRILRFMLGAALVIAVLGSDYLPPAIGGHAQILRAQSATLTQQASARLDSAAQVATTATSAATLTLTPNGGETIYIYQIDIENCSDATGATAAAVTTITTTNIGSLAFTMGSGSTTAGAFGGPGLCQTPLTITYPTGLKSAAAGTATTFVLPAFATHQTIRINVYYRSAPVQ